MNNTIRQKYGMESLFSRLGENKVTQAIQTNSYEQAIEYKCACACPMENVFEDLLKRKAMSSNSLHSSSTGSLVGMTGIAGSQYNPDLVYHADDAFAYVMAFVKNPTIGVYSKDRIPRLLADFRRSILEDEASFAVKKLTKGCKQAIANAIAAQTPIKPDDKMLLYFAHYLKTNIVVVAKGPTLIKSMLCSDDTFDTVVIEDLNNRGTYKIRVQNGKHILSWQEAKDYIVDKRFFDANFLDCATITDLRAIAEKSGVSTTRTTEDGKKHKLLKAELKSALLQMLS